MKIKTRELRNQKGTVYTVYDMTTGRGMTVSVTALGAAIQKVAIREETGREQPLTLGFEDMGQYESCIYYAGATLGPNAGRIGNALLPVGTQLYQLSKNDGQNQLHGGVKNLSSRLWEVTSVTSGLESASILLSASQPDGLDGYPGNRTYHAKYTLEDTNWLTIEYTAVTDVSTYINMSNHTYWNLSGDFSVSGLEQEIQVFANNVCINNKDHLPADIIPAADTVFDFRSSKQLLSRIRSAKALACKEQLSIGRGYNNAYILNKNQTFRPLRFAKRPGELKRACILRDKKTGRTLKMMTDAPALVLYSGGFLPHGIALSGGASSFPSCAVALEAQDIPDVMHLLPGNYRLTTPDNPFYRTIRYHIS
ncbi:aldose epimerase family protein [Lacrimispora indolis]|uniref:aldose epimerase family protein n=1 Tax=Lacrimispora indolis TaxID=69825 RepID=UPI00041941FF|nr:MULTISPECIES: aldose epimerase family protein [Lachnospiraceae]MBE7718385.1 galactose mutarotase [Lacrimispora celerecrescens]